MVAVLDASAVLALTQSEPGSAAVVPYLGDAVISSANYAEVIFGITRRGVEMDAAKWLIHLLRIDVVPFTQSHAVLAAGYGSVGAAIGLSLGDRACLATAAHLGAPAVTADRVWADLDLDVEVVVIR